MSTMLPSHHHPYKEQKAYLSQYPIHYSTTTGSQLESAKVLIKGDMRLVVTELEAALHPIIGRYCIEMTGMQEPLHTLWHAEGQVLCRQARSTDIAFDVREARTGETRTYLVAVQVTESGAQGKVVQSGVFVQIHVRERTCLQESILADYTDFGSKHHSR